MRPLTREGRRMGSARQAVKRGALQTGWWTAMFPPSIGSSGKSIGPVNRHA